MAGLRDFFGGFAGALPESFEIENRRKGREQYQQQLDLTKSAQVSKERQDFIKGKQYKATLSSLGLAPEQIASLSEDVDDNEDIPFNQAQVVFNLLNRQEIASTRPSGSFVYMGTDPNTGQPMLLHNKSGQVTPAQLPSGVSSVAPKPVLPTGQERARMAEIGKQFDVLDKLESQAAQVQGSLGPVQGRIKEKIISQYGGGYSLSPEETDFFASLADMRNSMIRLITGAQMSEPEANRIMQQIPAASDTPQQFASKLRQTRMNVEFLQKRTQEVLGSSNVMVPTLSNQPAQPTQAQEISPLQALRQRRQSSGR